MTVRNNADSATSDDSSFPGDAPGRVSKTAVHSVIGLLSVENIGLHVRPYFT